MRSYSGAQINTPIVSSQMLDRDRDHVPLPGRCQEWMFPGSTINFVSCFPSRRVRYSIWFGGFQETAPCVSWARITRNSLSPSLIPLPFLVYRNQFQQKLDFEWALPLGGRVAVDD